MRAGKEDVHKSDKENIGVSMKLGEWVEGLHEFYKNMCTYMGERSC